MFNELKAALKQWKDDTQYISKIAPSDWGARAHAYAQKTIIDLYAKIDAFEAAKTKELSEALAKLSAEKDAEIEKLKAKIPSPVPAVVFDKHLK